MNRRRFIALAAMAPAAAAVAEFLPKPGACGKADPDYVGLLARSVEWRTSHRFQPGDMITIGGFPKSRGYNGSYRMNAERVFEGVSA